MAQNDLVAAEQLIAQADALGINYGPLYLGDTPKAAMRDLQQRRNGGGNPLLPQVFQKNRPAVNDPFAAGAANALPAAAAGMPQPVRLPPIEQMQAMPQGGGFGAAVARPGEMPSGDANGLLLKARQALAVGDARRAGSLTAQAKALPRGVGDDSPEHLEALIRRHSDLMALPGDRRDSEGFRREYARLLLEQAEGLLRRGDVNEAERLAQQAARQQITLGSLEMRPEVLLERIAAARRQNLMPGTVMPAGGVTAQAMGQAVAQQQSAQAIYYPAHDATRNMQASHLQSPLPTPSQEVNMGQALYEQGESALRAHDTASALRYFREAITYRDQLDPVVVQRMQDQLQFLSASQQRPPQSIAEEAATQQQVLIRQVQAELLHQESTAKATMSSDPKRALAMMEQARQKVETSGLDPAARDQLLRRADRTLNEMRQFVNEYRPRIELQEKNRRIEGEIERTQKTKLEIQEKLAATVDEYNRLLDEQRFAEAEVVAKRASELDPENPVVRQLLVESRLIRRFHANNAIRSDKEQGFLQALENVDSSAVPFDDNNPLVFPDGKKWENISKSRKKLVAEMRRRRRSERDLEIEQKLKTPVSLQFENAPLSAVTDYLGRLAGVNVFLDPQGLADEGVTSDTPVTIKLQNEISLKSALNLILQPMRLTYVIKDEVLKITNEHMRDGEVFTVTYDVADLVIPIPNFSPSPNMGLAGALSNAMHNAGFGTAAPFGMSSAPMAVVASRDGSRSHNNAVNPTVMAQMAAASGGMGLGGSPMGVSGPGGAGGGTAADFDSLIELITRTVRPQSWDTVGGAGSIAEFETNLSIVVSQTQEVHDEIVNLLEQLRKLQDLQVTIEVRFITVTDSFFERIGVDFDFDINDNADKKYQVFGRSDASSSTAYTTTFNANTGVARDVTDRDLKKSDSATVGLSAPGVFSADLDIPFSQNSYGLAVPEFGGYSADSAASLGFAILSDIEAYFFITAAQGDSRSNVLQAPKVTLFNGQQAFVSDTSQSPFVISVIPVVGDFAAAQQPVIVVLSEGTFLTVQAVVSADRRFVRLTVVPFFSKITDVDTFTFTGKTTTSQDSSEESDNTEDSKASSSSKTTSTEGTTVQLPTFSFVTVTTTVSVPDGGTVLLGGIKRLSEGRNEYGIPMLNKIPYINRLFKNTGIGRETQSLMMMVTPRIIIQEEEEERLGL